MLSFAQYITEIYSEPSDSSFTHEDHRYDLNGLLSATLGMPVENFPVAQLTWIFKYDNPNRDRSRIRAADVSAPVLIVNDDGQLVVIDGLHRLEKAKEENDITIPGIFVSNELLSRYRIS